ncbi:MAG: HPr family phosphocarrier protein [Clostridia bacterium]|nr:HPr family phosphocarrier protein [Deltaproteobacteria bacterium]
MSGPSKRSVRIVNDLGLHLRAAGVLVQVAGEFKSDIILVRATPLTQKANAKSIMSVLALAAGRGTELSLEAEGADAEQAVEALCGLISRGFET